VAVVGGVTGMAVVVFTTTGFTTTGSKIFTTYGKVNNVIKTMTNSKYLMGAASYFYYDTVNIKIIEY
jgi:L-ascorbate metabolism protein UlaG (beta-lactamase superfamily)